MITKIALYYRCKRCGETVHLAANNLLEHPFFRRDRRTVENLNDFILRRINNHSNSYPIHTDDQQQVGYYMSHYPCGFTVKGREYVGVLEFMGINITIKE